MNFRQRFKAAIQSFRRTDNSIGGNLNSDLGRHFLKYGGRKPLVQNWSQVLMTDQDLYTGYSYAAINNRANAVSQLATDNIKTRANDAITQAVRNKDEVVIHPYLPIIDKSKSFSNYKFWYDISTYLDLKGIYYLMSIRTVVKNPRGEARVGNIQEFKLLNPYEIKRVRDKETLEIGGYVEAHDGLYREIAPEMIIEIQKLNPFSRDEPYAMTDAMKDAQFTLKTAGDYTRHAISNNINAPGIISTDLLLEPERFQNFKSRIINHEKPGEPLFGNGSGMINWQDMQIDLNKASLDKINELNLNNVSATSGVSKTMFAIEQSGVTRDTAKVQRDLLVSNHITPQLQLIIDALCQDYKTYYEQDYEKYGYIMYIDSPLGVDRDSELKDVQIRKDSLEIYNTLLAKGYDSEVAAKYSSGEISLGELGAPALNEISTTDTTTGIVDTTEDKQNQTDTTTQAVEDKHIHLGAIKNQFDEQAQRIINTQEAMLQNVIVNIEESLSLTVLNRVTKNAFENQDDIISEQQRKEYINELELALAAFYGVILPTYAKTLLNRRISEFGLFADFKLTRDVKAYIKEIAAKGAESHIDTIISDLFKAIRETLDIRIKAELQTLMEAEAAQLSPEQVKELMSRPVTKDSEIYKLAERKALTGAGQQEIISAIKSEYKDISTNRAKAIARTETNRAFTQSQYQADRQFIKQNNLEGRAYKKWVTRSGNPCAICRSLAGAAPIPFSNNFANLGDELSATYEDNGKVKVLKQKINYEALSAGNAHVNCQCIYQLIIM